MKKLLFFIISFSVIFSCLFCSFTATAAVAPDGEYMSNIIALYNLDTDAMVFEKNADRITDPSSLTKVVTAIVAMENCADIDSTRFTATKTALDPLKKTISLNAGIKEGEELTVRQLLICLLDHSANEAANVLAENVGGSVEQFVEMMNAFVKKIGCTDTNFVNAHGIYEYGQYTNARDMLLIGKYAMGVPGFMDIVNLKSSDSLKIPATSTNSEHKLVQRNKMLLKSTSYYYPYASGIKTGSSGDGKYCVMVSAAKDGYKYLCVIMEAPTVQSEDKKTSVDMSMTEAANLFKWAFKNLKYKTIVNKAITVWELPVEYSWDTDHVQLVPENDVSALVPADLEASGVLVEPNRDSLPERINAPAAKGDVVGTASVIIAGEKMKEINLVLADDVKRSNTLFILNNLKAVFTSKPFKIAVVSVVLLIIIYIIINIIYNRRRRKLRLARSSEMLGRNYKESKKSGRSGASKYANNSDTENRSVHTRKK